MLYIKTSYNKKFDSLAFSSPDGFIPSINIKKTPSDNKVLKYIGQNRSSLGRRMIHDSAYNAPVQQNELVKKLILSSDTKPKLKLTETQK
jgi:hypothetical protein